MARFVRARLTGWLWAVAGVGGATYCFYLLRHYLDKGQASLLYLPVVIACAVRYGFSAAVAGALLSFACWDFFFLPPYGTLLVYNPKDWISLFVFLVAAVVTAQLAAQARAQTQAAEARQQEIATLFEASESISQTVSADRLLPEIARRLMELCHSRRCVILQWTSSERILRIATDQTDDPDAQADSSLILMAQAAAEHGQVIGFGGSPELWEKALALTGLTAGANKVDGAYIPLHTNEMLVGILYIGPRRDGRPFASTDERLIRTLANHAAVVIMRQSLAEEAAQATVLRQADILKDSLLSVVSHELRTPLAAIKATATGLLQPDAAPLELPMLDALSSIDKEADRLSLLVSKMLDLSRLEAGAWQPDRDWCDITDIVGSVLDRLAPADGGRVIVEIGADEPLIYVDYIQIALVVSNLLENALKYSSEDSSVLLTTISIWTAAEMRISIRDFGSGIPAGEEEDIFTRFYRGTLHRNGTVHGTGIGLSLCKAIVEEHGGRIWAANCVGEGTSGAIITFSLPLRAMPGNSQLQ